MRPSVGCGRGDPCPYVHVVFSPHLLPVNRGILSTMYVWLPADAGVQQVRALYEQAYADDPFVHLLP